MELVRSMRVAAIHAAEHKLRCIAEPADDLVERPPLRKGRLRIAFAVWLFISSAALCVVGMLTFGPAHVRIPVHHVSGSNTAALVRKSGCRETTQYPLTVAVPWHYEKLIEVTLLGPKYLNAQALENTFTSMHCRLLVDHNHDDLSFKIHGYGIVNSNPADFRRTCQGPHSLAKDAQVKISFETSPTRFLSLFNAIRSVRGLEHLPLPRNVSDFFVSALFVKRVPLDQSDRFATSSRFRLALEDGRRYEVTFSITCGENLPMTQQIIRWCTSGAPFLKKRQGRGVTSDLFPDDCPVDGNDPAVVHFNQTLHRVLSHSIMKMEVQAWGNKIWPGDALPELRSALDAFCRRDWLPLRTILGYNSGPDQTSEEMIRQLAWNVSRRRVYEVACDQTSFGGVLTWLSLLFPFLTVWMKISGIVIPFTYKNACVSGVSAENDDVIGPQSVVVVDTDRSEAEQPRRQLSDMNPVDVTESETKPPVLMSSFSGSATEDDLGEKLHVDSNMSEDVDRDCNRCTDENSAKPFARDGAVTSDWDAACQSVFPHVRNLLHCLVDAAVSKHVERIRSEMMSMAIAESRMPARDVHSDGCPPTTLEEVQCDVAANGSPRVVHNLASIVEDLQECQVAIAALSSHCCTLETMFRRMATWNTATEESAHGVDAEECTLRDTSQRSSRLRGSVCDPLLSAEARTRSAITLLVCRLEQSLAILPRCTAVDTASRHLDQFREGWQLRAGGIIDTGTSMRRTKCQL